MSMYICAQYGFNIYCTESIDNTAHILFKLHPLLHSNGVVSFQFSESLCLCIESLMDCGSKESHRLHLNISESKREALLLRLAEPLQFMHSLDLAHIFEHYYR